MKTTRPTTIVRNFKNIRSERQDSNNSKVRESIKTNDKKLFNKSINTKAFSRVIKELKMNEEQIFEKCNEDDTFCKLLSMNISKKSSRQGSKDETEQLKTCNLTSQKCGVNIQNLSATAFRPTKKGKIISQTEMKDQKISKDECFKSFDGVISGRMIGYITAKVAFGSGGHQDNVFEEMDAIAEWWGKFKAGSTDLLVLLIDTDLLDKFSRIKKKYQNIKNILVFSHIDLQEYIINTHYSVESI
jgi:hypothetical protein